MTLLLYALQMKNLIFSVTRKEEPELKKLSESLNIPMQELVKASVNKFLEKELDHPRLRLRLTRTSPKGSVIHQAQHAIGLVAVDSKFSEFDSCQQKMTESVIKKWYSFLSEKGISSRRI